MFGHDPGCQRAGIAGQTHCSISPSHETRSSRMKTGRQISLRAIHRLLSPLQGSACVGNRDPGRRRCAPCPGLISFAPLGLELWCSRSCREHLVGLGLSLSLDLPRDLPRDLRGSLGLDLSGHLSGDRVADWLGSILAQSDERVHLPSLRFRAASQARPFSVRRYFWRRLFGLSGMVISIMPSAKAGSR
jgi:hypothetical protein